MAPAPPILPKLLLAASLTTLLLPVAGTPEKRQQPAQSAATTKPATATPSAVNYPETAGGLKQLAVDIVKAQEKTDIPRAEQLLTSLVLPNYREWYPANFTEPAAARAVPAYAANATGLPAQLARIFLTAYQEGFHGIDAVRYDDEKSACSSPPVFSAMTLRRTKIPLYELRFTHGDQFKRLVAFAYVDGAFRLVLVPDFSRPSSQASQTPSEPDSTPSSLDRIRMGGQVTAAQLLCRVQPNYPEEARRQYISGTVRFHTIIAKDGSIKQLEVLSGPDILVQAARAAVSRWRYRPTMLKGEPVEVDTTIDVIFSLNR